MYHTKVGLSKRFRPSRRNSSRISSRIAENPLEPRINIGPFATQESDQAQVELERQIEGQTRGGTDGGQDWNSSGDTFLRNLKANPSRNEDHRILERQILEPGTTDQLIDRVVPSDILTYGQQFALEREQGGGVQSSGGIKCRLNLAQRIWQAVQNSSRGLRRVRHALQSSSANLFEAGFAADTAGAPRTVLTRLEVRFETFTQSHLNDVLLMYIWLETHQILKP